MFLRISTAYMSVAANSTKLLVIVENAAFVWQKYPLITIEAIEN